VHVEKGTMTLTLAPDVEKIASDYLRTHADIVALNTRIVGKTPDLKTTSWVRVTELNGSQVGLPHHLQESLMQFDCYAGATGGQPEANTLAKTVTAVLVTLPGTRTGGVITGVQILGGPRQLDTDIEPARDYKIITALIWSHP
jgi:hypothetical protein